MQWQSVTINIVKMYSGLQSINNLLCGAPDRNKDIEGGQKDVLHW